MKKLLLVLSLLLIVGCAQTQYTSTTVTNNNQTKQVAHQENYVPVKYSDNKVDIGDSRFEYLDTSKSSFIRGAWYDKDNGYMIINLNRTYYHYCSMPSTVWESFKLADSFGSYYNKYIKGNYDCRINPIPDY